MAINKVVYGNQTLLDLTADSVTPEKLAAGVTAHNKAGEVITGTNTFDADTSDADATASEILYGSTAYVNGVKITGEMANRGSIDEKIAAKEQAVTIQSGFHDGSGKVSLEATAVAQLIPENVRKGCTILGIEGSMSGSEDENPEVGKEVTPTKEDQTITPSAGFTCFREILVKAIPYVETPNSAGGITATIASN